MPINNDVTVVASHEGSPRYYFFNDPISAIDLNRLSVDQVRELLNRYAEEDRRGPLTVSDKIKQMETRRKEQGYAF